MNAFLFPGQGSQRTGMGESWKGTGAWRRVEAFSDATGRDIAHLLLTADGDELKTTGNAQLATFTLSLVILAAVREAGYPEPVALAGHSLGEYTALVAAGVLDETAGARLVAARGAAMQAAATARPGTMAAVLGLDVDAVGEACAGVTGAWVANDNAPGQVVIAGTQTGVDTAAERARQRGAKRVMPLAVSGAFHTPMMAAAQEGLDAVLATTAFADATVPAVANVDAAAHTTGGQWRHLLSAQLTSPVRWRESLGCVADMGVTTFVELGPGTELSGMVKRTVPTAGRANVAAPADLAALPR